MARIAGVNIPTNKRVLIALQYIHGIGPAKAREIVSLFGQAVDAHGKPIANARVEAGTDFAIADDHGYFTVTAPRGEAMTVKTPSGGACLNKRIDDVIGKEQYGLIYRVGTVACNQ